MSGVVAAPWIYGNGTWNDPPKKGGVSVAKTGATLQFEVSTIDPALGARAL